MTNEERQKSMSERQLATAIQELINTAAEQTAGNIYRGQQTDEAKKE